MRFKLFLLMPLMLIISSCTGTSQIALERWTSYDGNDFPARISSVILADRSELTPGGQFADGSWVVEMRPAPVATYFYENTGGSDFFTAITIEGFQCSNAISGSYECLMRLSRQTLGSFTFCGMVVSGDTLTIPCPYDIDLDF